MEAGSLRTQPAVARSRDLTLPEENDWSLPGAIYANDMVIRIDIGICSLAICYLFNGRMYAE